MTPHNPSVPRPLLVALVALACVASTWATSITGAEQMPAQGDAAAIPVDVLVLDRDGRLVEGLRPSDFTVNVDGRNRPILWVKRVSRGPGATTDSASRQASGDGSIVHVAEPRRNVVIVVDQSTLPRGDERIAIQAAGAFLDRLGIDDRIAVVPVPAASDTLLELTTERPPAREVLSRVAGRAVPASAITADDLAGRTDPVVAPDPDPGIPDPERAKVAERPALVRVWEGASDAELATSRGSLGALSTLILALQQVPGRKVVALFSAGLLSPSTSRVTETAAAAVAGRATIYAFGLRGHQGNQRDAPDLAPIETLARSTGGAFVMLDRNPERNVERAVTEVSACYVLGIQAAPSDSDGRRHALRVGTTRKGLSVRSGAWLSTGPDPGDIAVPTAAATDKAPAPGARPSPATPAPRRPAREAELKLALARLSEYVDAYERQYSVLVAEEDYHQWHRSGRVRLRSDLLLVRSPDQWISFRDVFEVDGQPVRDREDRLKRLFLDPTPEARARFQSVIDESARYNVGPVVRTINVPLFPLEILKTSNRSRFDFKLGRDGNSAGARVWRVEYAERMGPTLVQNLEGEDVPITGRFLVDQLTGAIVETSVEMSRGLSRGEIVVRYGRDAALGLWVPIQMRETYTGERSLLADGRADYSKFRRFQVKTEEEIVLPKR